MIAWFLFKVRERGLHVAEVSNKATHSMQNRNDLQSLFVMIVFAGICYSQLNIPQEIVEEYKLALSPTY